MNSTVSSPPFTSYFGGKPSGKCIQVLTPGNGKDSNGKVRVQLLESVGAYRKGEVLEIGTYQAVPVKQEIRKPGSVFRYVNTLYSWA